MRERGGTGRAGERTEVLTRGVTLSVAGGGVVLGCGGARLAGLAWAKSAERRAGLREKRGERAAEKEVGRTV